MRNVFGWDLPPGCSMSDIDNQFGQEGPCLRCGEFVDDCTCPECPECHSFGCMEHEAKEYLWQRLELLRAMVLNYEGELKKRNLPMTAPMGYDDPDIAPPEELRDDEQEGA